MKVLHVISSIDPRTGGPATALSGLSLAQHHVGLDVRVVSTFAANDNTDLAQKLADQGVKTCVVGPVTAPLGRHPDLCPTLAEAIADCDIVHIHAIWEEIQHQAACLAHTLRRPYIFRPCGMLDPWSLNQSRLKKKIYLALRLRKDLNSAAAMHYTTATERDLAKPLGLSPASIVEPNGVNLDEFDTLPPRGMFRDKYPQIGSRPLITFLSRVHHKKGLDLLVPAVAKLPQKDAMLVIAGPDAESYTDKVRELARNFGIEDRVIFTGMLYGQERIAALVDADLFCLPSYQENFGIAVVEALAAGTPVIISDQVNLYSDVLEAKVGGVVPCKINPLAAELERWLGDPDLRRHAAAAARPFVWQRYDWKQIAQRWSDHYHGLLAQRKRPISK
ncbi:MAG TPA: glycosyltransferase [Tepidisphaeraceae bacterium]|jgi:glycosyltransferase involved in cell wall biosynthesis